MKTTTRLVASILSAAVLYGTLVFVPAGTLHYWQGWAYVAVAMVSTIAMTGWLALTNPAALQRRMKGGPRAEQRTVQKFVVTGIFLAPLGMIAFSAFDHRMGWSSVPGWVSVIGDVLVALGMALASVVVVQNAYAAATITVEKGQTLASDGVYGWVRHPMYVGAMVVLLGIPLALGSYWGLLIVILGGLAFVLRILDEEKLLNQELAGYRRYTQRVRYRLVPHLW